MYNIYSGERNLKDEEERKENSNPATYFVHGNMYDAERSLCGQ